MFVDGGGASRMIGIIIEAATNEGELPNKILYRINGKSVLEHVVLNCLKVEMAHDVVVSIPAADQAYVTGSTFKGGQIRPANTTALNRSASYQFKGLREEPITRLHQIAMHRGIDTIVRISGLNLFIQPWLINEVLRAYLSKNLNCFLHTQALDYLTKEQKEEMYGEGLEIEIIPYWMLSQAALYCENQEDLSDYLATNFNTYKYTNTGKNLIPRVKESLRFESNDQLVLFEPLLREISYGADLGDLLGDLNEKKSNVEE
jgi:spore coat polysaccharide biosynthesis protein SpsF